MIRKACKIGKISVMSLVNANINTANPIPDRIPNIISKPCSVTLSINFNIFFISPKISFFLI